MLGSLQSAVEIGFRHDEARDCTVLSRRQAGGLCHLSKPYWTGEVLGLQLVNPTAGLFAGDELTLDVDIAAKAQVALTSPSATRYHTMPEGRADVVQHLRIGEGAWLDYWPEIVIPQGDSDVRQTTKIQLAPKASMVFLDLLAPGRVAHGERYAFRKLETRLEVYQDHKLLAKERCVLEPSKDVWPLKVPNWDLCYYGALWIAGAQASQCLKSLNLINSDAHLGGSLVAENLAVIRVVAASSLLLRRVTQQLRTDLQQHLPLLSTDFRKL